MRFRGVLVAAFIVGFSGGASTIVSAGDAPTETGYSYSGGDGSSISNAIVVNAITERDGIRAEYAWIRTHWPGARRRKQALIVNELRPYDCLTITDASGKDHDLYFDITAFFGNMSAQRNGPRKSTGGA